MKKYQETIEKIIKKIEVRWKGKSEVDIHIFIKDKEIEDFLLSVLDLCSDGIDGWDFFTSLTPKEREELTLGIERLSTIEPENVKKVIIGQLAKIVRNKYAEILTLPCMIESIAETEGYMTACEEVAGTYIPQEELDNIHKETHKLLRMLLDSTTLRQGSSTLNMN